MPFITVAEAANRLGLRPRRVQQLIASGALPAAKLGRDWLIEDSALATVSHRRRPGRPRKIIGVPPA
jgi:excisionase family DNA binding protein